MKNMFLKTSSVGLWLAAFVFTVTACGDPGSNSTDNLGDSRADTVWSENYQESLATAKAEGRPLLLLFTGSDWCPPCKQLERTVFQSQAFQEFAADNLVLMKADFPRGKQEEAIARQNLRLQQQYPVRAYPTVLLVEPESEKVLAARPGYGGQSPEDYVGELRKALPRE